MYVWLSHLHQELISAYTYLIDSIWSGLPNSYTNGLQLSVGLLAVASHFIDIELDSVRKPVLFTALRDDFFKDEGDHQLVLPFLCCSNRSLRLKLLHIIIDRFLKDPENDDRNLGLREAVEEGVATPSWIRKRIIGEHRTERRGKDIFKKLVSGGLVPALMTDLLSLSDSASKINVIFVLTKACVFCQDDRQLAGKLALVPRSFLRFLDPLEDLSTLEMTLSCLTRLAVDDFLELGEFLPALIDLIVANGESSAKKIAIKVVSFVKKSFYRPRLDLHLAVLQFYATQIEAENRFSTEEQMGTIIERQRACLWLYFHVCFIPFMLYIKFLVEFCSSFIFAAVKGFRLFFAPSLVLFMELSILRETEAGPYKGLLPTCGIYFLFSIMLWAFLIIPVCAQVV